MKKHFLLITLVATAFAACKKDGQKPNAGRPETASRLATAAVCEPCNTAPKDLPDVISGNRTLYSDTCYILDGKTWVKNGTLTIQPGTVIKGIKKATASEASALIVTRNASINAAGTADCPIVFTSNETTKAAGDWGGVVVLGDALVCTTTGTAQIEGINPVIVPAGVDYTYGGTTANDNSGTLSYIRIEYAGAVIQEGNELNGLTLGGVGCGTTMDHIEVMYGADDGFEFFGGNVNGKYLLAIANNDDQFDFDFGYKGNLQFLVSIIKPSVEYAANNSNGIECDGGQVSSCYSRPVISNMTIVGAPNCTVTSTNQLLNGTRFRNNTYAVMRNSIVYGYPTAMRLESAVTTASFNNTDSCGTSGTATYLFNNAVQACVTAFATFTPHSSTTSNTVAGLNLSDAFPTAFADYFDPIASPLAPAAPPTSNKTGFCGLLPVNCSYAFNTVAYKGGAVDPSGNYWLGDTWIRF